MSESCVESARYGVAGQTQLDTADRKRGGEYTPLAFAQYGVETLDELLYYCCCYEYSV